ncbi:hypothetical protein P3T76_014060 [Phytophthora citrophthora]|uniref:PX domain-containing protein n=1 Tax=Phytophthora citrophthora TaxID=4793 RepID=A0AAD9G1M3_9STRA|nr:hypothetical protein P3T76_014060 [Phytophthora citrophthora]
MESTPTDVGTLEPLTPTLVNQSGEVVAATPVLQPAKPEHQQCLNHEAHRRWRANTAVDLLGKVNSIDIVETRINQDSTLLYVLEVQLSSPTSRLSLKQSSPVLKIARSFSEFEELREGILKAVSVLPPCTCQYCLDFLVYVRFNLAQPRGFVKFTAGTEKRKKILAQFTTDMVAMGKRRAEKVGKRECEAQLTIPVLLEEFLLGQSSD